MFATRVYALLVVIAVCGSLPGARLAPAQEGSPHIVEAPALSPEEQLKTFHLPPGFSIQLVAAEPEVRKPMNLNFDAQGRLWFTQSVEYPYPVAPGTPGRDTLRVIEGLDADGRATEVKTFVDGLAIPIGQTPVPGGAIVFSVPNIYRATDADGDGTAERREVLFGEFGYRDTHGLNNSFTRWIDGWVYACHGYVNSSPVAGSDGKGITLEGGAVYRFREDGSHIEHFTHGQVNPFGLAFDAMGNLFSADCHTQPAYMLLRGGYYPSFGKPHDGLGFAPPIMRHAHGSTGIAGIACYEADHFPREFQGNLFIGNPITHRVNRDVLKTHGSSFEAVEQPDFLTSDDPWFRPVDIKLGPDGALYIADFYNCIIGHYEVPLDHPKRDRERGRIWRIVYTGTTEERAGEAPVIPNLNEMTQQELLARLGDPNITVRQLATNELVDRFGEGCIDAVRTRLDDRTSTATERSCGLWILGRLGALDAPAIERLLDDDEPIVRVHALKWLAEQSASAVAGVSIASLAREALRDDDPFVRRAAADCLGQHIEEQNVGPLLELWQATPNKDAQLVHTVRMALRDHLAVPELMQAVAQRVRARGFDAETHEKLTQLCLGIPSSAAAELALNYLRERPELLAKSVDSAYQLLRYAPEERVDEVHQMLLKRRGQDAKQQCAILMAAQRAARDRGVDLPRVLAAWGEELAQGLLASSDREVQVSGVDLAREMKIVSLLPRLAELAADRAGPELRIGAMVACVNIDGARATDVLKSIMLNTADELAIRQRAARELGTVNSDAAREILLEYLPLAPQRLAVEVASSLSASKAGAEQLLDAIERGKASPMLLQEPIVVLRFKLLQDGQLEQRAAELTADLPSRDEQVRGLIDARLTGLNGREHDLDRGKEVFTKSCAICHKIGGAGEKIGPELDGIGIRGAERILEDVLDPNRNVDQAFRSTVLIAGGKAYSGLLKSENDNVVVLIDSAGKEVTISKDEIDEDTRKASPLSPMPANVQDSIAEKDFYDLIAFLLSQQPEQ